MIRHSFVLFCMLIAVFSSAAAEAARPRRLSAAQIKKNQEQVAFMQLEMMRYQSEMTAKQQEVYRSFDENGNGHLEGGEKARFDKRMHAIQTGAEPNPFAFIVPVGKGPRPKSPLDELKQKALRYKAEAIAKQQEIYRSFDENGNGHLEGGEKARFDKHMYAIQTGAEPNPFAALGSTDPGDKNAKKESAGAK